LANQAVATSSDGIHWTRRGIPVVSGSLARVRWNGSVWVATSYGGSNDMISSDGLRWTNNAAGLPFGGDIAYGADLFLAISSFDWTDPSTANLASSPDGVTWTYRPSPLDTTTETDVFPFAFALDWSESLGLFVAIGYAEITIDIFVTASTIQVATSPDGITWTSAGAPFPWSASVNGMGVAVGGLRWIERLGLWVYVNGSNGSVDIVTSPDGTTWTGRGNIPPGAGISETFGGLVDNGSKTFAVVPGQLSTGWPDEEIIESSDGVTWSSGAATPWSTGGNNQFYDMAYNDGTLVCIGQAGAGTNFLYSTDGGSVWHAGTMPISPYGVDYADGLFVAVGNAESTQGWHVGKIALQNGPG
jgi:hypothetical protein